MSDVMEPCPHHTPNAGGSVASELHGVCIFCWRDRACRATADLAQVQADRDHWKKASIEIADAALVQHNQVQAEAAVMREALVAACVRLCNGCRDTGLPVDGIHTWKIGGTTRCDAVAQSSALSSTAGLSLLSRLEAMEKVVEAARTFKCCETRCADCGGRLHDALAALDKVKS